MSNSKINFAFFGTDQFSVGILDELEKAGFIPSLIITVEDKPVGRKLIMTPPHAKIWAEKHGIPLFQPKTLREERETGITEKIKTLTTECDVFIVASYGKIIPQAILDIPKHGTLNVHPSLLPKLRGPSPMVSAILSEEEAGVTIIKLDAEMDHGPIVAQEKIEISDWPPYIGELEKISAERGGKMLAKILSDWIEGKITTVEQDHTQATLCKKITKEDGLIDFNDSPEKNLRKIRAFGGWPTTYYFSEKDGKHVRIIITRARLEDGKLIIEKVIPEGKKEMDYKDFERGLK